MSKKREDIYDTVYYVDYPVYASKEKPDYSVGIMMGDVWVKAVARDILRKKYGLMYL